MGGCREAQTLRRVNLGGKERRAARIRDYAAPAQRTHDDRLCAAVIADPLVTPFSDQALLAMPPAKLLFFRPETENVLKAEFHVSRVVRLLKQRDDFPNPEDILVREAHHFSFLAPVPESVAMFVAPRLWTESWPPPESFDLADFREAMNRRTALHEEMNRTIVTFFKQALSDCVKH